MVLTVCDVNRRWILRGSSYSWYFYSYTSGVRHYPDTLCSDVTTVSAPNEEYDRGVWNNGKWSPKRKRYLILIRVTSWIFSITPLLVKNTFRNSVLLPSSSKIWNLLFWVPLDPANVYLRTRAGVKSCDAVSPHYPHRMPRDWTHVFS
jgi:hypothetical protein